MRLIDANALHAKIFEENRRNYTATENVAQILLRIETAPTIEPEDRHGKSCEYCKGRLYTKKPFIVITPKGRRIDVCFNFCPNCGADMRKVREENA